MKYVVILLLLSLSTPAFGFDWYDRHRTRTAEIKTEPKVDYRPLIRDYDKVQRDLFTLRWHRRYGTPQTQRAAKARAWNSVRRFNNTRLKTAKQLNR